MKTSIAGFCTEFSEALFPLAQALGDTVRTLESTDADGSGLTDGFSHVRHRLDALINKVQGQEAYVLLFGPLKSGKSTLINAISGGYVSEVTSLPAYPCMVYLKYGPEPSYSIIRYSGKRESLPSPEALKELLAQSHRTLSDRIRAMEDFGETFDPAVHLPSAIRRVLVELPVDNLRESGTVLVDTPGLYSRMKFGYDYMTQEFRDSAACAVFVVKTDNLFLEQVFSDFNDLLDQFSRVFVVVNIDTGKADLRPDGELEPSLESREPDEIVKAFEVLTMSAPLRRAAENGRLHIYPIDLRSAAARRLKGEDSGPDAQQDRFDGFLADLTGYLNSNEYMQEFVADTLRQAGRQCDEIGRLCSPETLGRLRSERTRRTGQLDETRRRGEAVGRLQEVDWHEALSTGARAATEELSSGREEAMSRLSAAVPTLVENWLDSDQPLQQLAAAVHAEVRDLTEGFWASASGGLRRLAEHPLGGAELSPEQQQDLGLTGLDIAAAVQPAARGFDADRPEAPAEPDLGALPIKRSFADRLLLRPAPAIRRKLIPAPDSPINRAQKQKHLGAGAAAYVGRMCEAALQGALDKVQNEFYEPRLRSYLDSVTAGVREQLGQRKTALDKERDAMRSEIAAMDRAAGQLEALAGVCAGVRADITALEQQQPVVAEPQQPGPDGERDTDTPG